MKKLTLILTLTLVFLSSLAVSAQTKFDLDNPTGTYVITDYIGKKITLKLQPKSQEEFYGRIKRGKGTITINGRTIPGTWERMDNDNHLRFETYGGKRIKYNLPEGPVNHYQILISDDGKASSCLPSLSKDYITVKKVTASSKRKSASKAKRKRK